MLIKGKPAPGIRVTMHPQFEMGRITWGVVGETGPTGEFTIGTGGIGNGRAPAGDYVVTFTKPHIDSDPENGLEAEVNDFQGKIRRIRRKPMDGVDHERRKSVGAVGTGLTSDEWHSVVKPFENSENGISHKNTKITKKSQSHRCQLKPDQWLQFFVILVPLWQLPLH